MTKKNKCKILLYWKKDKFVNFLRASVSVHDRLDFCLYTYLISDFIEGAMSFWLHFFFLSFSFQDGRWVKNIVVYLNSYNSFNNKICL